MTIANIVSKSWTYTLTSDSLVIDSSFSFVIVSISCVSGVVTIVGDNTGVPIQPTPITLGVGQSLTINSGSASILGGLTIDASSGEALIVGR
jgi:Na+/H+ antiporter NhaD/arsenite permease-like protein